MLFLRPREMKTPNVPISSEGANGKILLVGDINKAFFDADTITVEVYEVSGTLPEAVKAAAKNNFTAIGVVMAGIPAKLSSALQDLREANSKACPERSRRAKIILLAQMYEEPIARQLVSPLSNGTRAADDYLICPVQVKTLYASIAALRSSSLPLHPQGQACPRAGGESTSMPDADYERPFLLSPESRRASEVAINEKLERRIKQLEALATTDDLTGLRNRRYIREFCRQILEHARKEKGQVTLLVFDIDNFKHYNDVYGHLIGDKILKQAAILMRRCCRTNDVVGRIGGDEFAVVFWDVPISKIQNSRRKAEQDHPKEAIFIAKRFRRELEKAELHLLGPKGEGVLTISGGLVGFPRDGSTAKELFQKADRALLGAKRSGKNRIYLVGQPQSDIADIE